MLLPVKGSRGMNCYILAGGQSKRFGRNKALYALNNGQTLLERVISVIPENIKAIKLVTNSPEDYRFIGLPMIPDVHPGLGPISGVHAGLVDSQYPFNFFLACDLPMISTKFIDKIVSAHCGQDIFGIKTVRGLSRSAPSIPKIVFRRLKLCLPPKNTAYKHYLRRCRRNLSKLRTPRHCLI